MKNNSYRGLLVWQTFFIVFGIVTSAFISRYHWKENFTKQVEEQLEHSLTTFIKVYDTKYVLLENVCNFSQKKSSSRLTLIRDNGVVVCDSNTSAEEMDNHNSRPELILAKKNSWGSAIRYSDTLKQDMFYGAIQWKTEKGIFYLRESIQISAMERTLTKVDKYIFIVLIPFLIVFSILSILLWHRYEVKKQEQLDRLKVDLVSNISHEVRTPLTSIKGFVQLLVSTESELSPNAKESLSKIEKNTNRLNSLFTEILDLNKVEKRKTTTIEEVDLEIMVDSILSNMNLIYKEKNIETVLNLESNIIKSDYELLEHILVNLIENAFKYNKDNGEVTITSSSAGSKTLIIISDTGNGIAPNHQERIFERFYRVDDARNSGTGGSGLGLAIVKHSVSHLNGEITFESKIDFGSHFKVLI